MRSTQEYFLSMILIILASVAIGFLLGRPYWFSKGLIEGITRGGDVWHEAIFGLDDYDDDDVLDAKDLRETRC